MATRMRNSLKFIRNLDWLDRIEAMLKRHLELNPGDKDMDPLIAAIRSARNGEDFDQEMFRELSKTFDYLFVNRPQPPAGPSGFFKRFFGS